MNKNRIIQFLDSLEKQGIMAAGQQTLVLRSEYDTLGGDGEKPRVNRSYENCGKGKFNVNCTNIGRYSCAGSNNEKCVNTADDSDSTDHCY